MKYLVAVWQYLETARTSGGVKHQQGSSDLSSLQVSDANPITTTAAPSREVKQDHLTWVPFGYSHHEGCKSCPWALN